MAYLESAVLGDRFLCQALKSSSFKYRLPSILAPQSHGILTRVKLRKICSRANIIILFYPHNLLRLCESRLVGMPADGLPTGQRPQQRFWGFTGYKTEAKKRINPPNKTALRCHACEIRSRCFILLLCHNRSLHPPENTHRIFLQCRFVAEPSPNPF